MDTLSTKFIFTNHTAKTIMSYKSYCKKGDTILARIQVIQQRIYHKKQINEITRSHSLHRNSVRNIISLYQALAPPEFKLKIEHGERFSQDEIDPSHPMYICQFLLPYSRKPRSHPKQASEAEEKKILADFQVVKVWAKKLSMMLSRKNEFSGLSIGKIRWVYKRNHLRVQKVRTKNGETRSLYNYQTIGVFADMHYDTKVLADQKSLPEAVYENLKYNEHLPIYEWNIIDVASRTRFIAYSRGKSSTFGLQFLVFVLTHIRSCGILTIEQGWHRIRMHTDWGVEFFSGSERKQAEWNAILDIFDAEIDCYNPNWDIRKNLIERSHRSDDEEFLIPFGANWKTKEDFMLQATEYSDYWNNKRSHSGHGMEGRTPREQLIKRWLPIWQVQRLLDFPVLHLDESFSLLTEHFRYYQIQQKFKDLTDTIKNPLWREDWKGIIDFITRYPEQDLQDYAQNVLTYYQKRNF